MLTNTHDSSIAAGVQSPRPRLDVAPRNAASSLSRGPAPSEGSISPSIRPPPPLAPSTTDPESPVEFLPGR